MEKSVTKSSYIYFRIGKENYAIIVNKVLEILQSGKLTHIPNSSEYIKGVLNFRGEIVPVIDMHKRFNMKKAEGEDNRMIIVIDLETEKNNVLMGLLVDQVRDVIEIDYKTIRKVPDIGINYNPEFLEGMIEKDDQFILLLNVDKVLKVSELAEIQNVVASKQTT